MMVNMTSICLLLVFTLATVESAKILGVFSMASYSHYILGRKLMLELAERGHEVTMISPYSESNPPKNYRDILLVGAVEQMKERLGNPFNMQFSNAFLAITMFSYIGGSMAAQTLTNVNFQKLLSDPNERFDLLIVQEFMNDALKGLSHHFGAPLISFSTSGTNTGVNELVGNPSPPSYIPHAATNYPPNMDFWQRTHNGLLRFWQHINLHILFYPQMNALIKTHFPGAPSVHDLNHNVSLVLANSHVSTSNPIPITPNIIEVGGFHVEPPKNLPKDLKDFLDSASDGVVYFSMGSNLKSEQMTPERRDAFIKVFSELKQKVLWKWENESLAGQTSNIKIGKWLPQQDILAHPNIKVFITHGGLLSTTEAVYHGVPVLGIPVFADQHQNMKNAELSGYGLALPYAELTEEKLRTLLNQLLNDAKYAQNAKRRSRIMHDQPITPLEKAMFWIEYVIRHRGAPHFRSAAVDLTWYQYHMLDVIAFVAASLLSTIYLSKLLLKRLICRKRLSPDIKKKQN